MIKNTRKTKKANKMDGWSKLKRLKRTANIVTYFSIRVRKTELVKVLLSNVQQAPHIQTSIGPARMKINLQFYRQRIFFIQFCLSEAIYSKDSHKFSRGPKKILLLTWRLPRIPGDELRDLTKIWEIFKNPPEKSLFLKFIQYVFPIVYGEFPKISERRPNPTNFALVI